MAIITRSFGDAPAVSAANIGVTPIGSINTNAPKLVLFRNQIGDLESMKNRSFLGIRLIGGNHSPTASSQWSSRDGYGAKIKIQAGETQFIDEFRCGEGYSAQNTSVIHVGLGAIDRIDGIEIHWPSGKKSSLGAVEANQLVTIYENPDQSPQGHPSITEPYRPNPTSR